MATSVFSDKFSWERVRFVFRYYWPVLRLQTIIYPLVSLVCYLIGLWISQTSLTGVVGMMFSGVLPFMVYFAPAILGRRQGLVFDAMLPARVSERLLVLAGYFLVGVPVMTYGIYYGLGWGIEHLFHISDGPISVMSSVTNAMLSNEVLFDSSVKSMSYVTTIVSMLSFAAVSLWVVLAFKRSRTIGSILVTAASWFGVSMITSIALLIKTFSAGYHAAMNGEELDSMQMGGYISSSVVVSQYIQAGVCFILLCVALWGIYRQVAHKQI